MLLVKIALFVGLLMTSTAMTNGLVGFITALIVLFVRGVSVFGLFSLGLGQGVYNGFLAGFIFTALVWGNLPFEDDAHGHDAHGAAHPPADGAGFWDAWGIAYRLVASLVVCLAASAFTAANSAPAAHILMWSRESVVEFFFKAMPVGAACLAVMTAFQVASNWSRALPQGPTPGGTDAAH